VLGPTVAGRGGPAHRSASGVPRIDEHGIDRRPARERRPQWRSWTATAQGPVDKFEATITPQSVALSSPRGMRGSTVV